MICRNDIEDNVPTTLAEVPFSSELSSSVFFKGWEAAGRRVATALRLQFIDPTGKIKQHSGGCWDSLPNVLLKRNSFIVINSPE